MRTEESNEGMGSNGRESSCKDALGWVHQEDIFNEMVQADLLETRSINRPFEGLVVDMKMGHIGRIAGVEGRSEPK